MQSSILILMLALGLPGANSCNAQQQGLPRVGQAPPAPVTEEPKPAVVEQADAEDSDSDADADAKEDSDADEMTVEPMEIELPDMQEIGTPEEAQSGCTEQKGQRITLDNTSGHCQTLRVGPGSTVILETRNGKPLQFKTQTMSPLGAMVLRDNLAPLAAMDGRMMALAQAAPQSQSQDDRVRELEQRVRELEAQLRARDENPPRAHARSSNSLGYVGAYGGGQARAEAEAERNLVHEMQAQAHSQARQYAEQARKQAAEIRAQSEELRKHVLDQAGHWKVYAGEARKGRSAYIAEAPGIAARVPPACEPCPPCDPAEACQPVAPPDAPGASATPAPATRMRSSNGPAAGAMPRMDDMRAMMEQMRAQMDEMREQMKSLRDELQRAPQRELR